MNNFPRRLMILKGGISKIANAITWLLNTDFSDTYPSSARQREITERMMKVGIWE